MNGTDERIRYLRDQLALHGSVFSCHDIEAIFQVFKDVPLKLIVVNVPREVFFNKIAQDAFEDLYKSFEAESSFIYLPSFNRAQILMKRPESALCARLKTQGWKLPDSILITLPADCPRSVDHDGLSCYIDHVQDADEDTEDSCERDIDTSMDTYDAEEPCTCELGHSPVAPPQTEFQSNLFNSSEPVSAVCSDLPASPSVPVLRSSRIVHSVGDRVNPSSDGRMMTPECENTSEASGDDGIAVTPNSISTAQSQCRRHGRKSERRMKHLAPPKPSRLFLLSPPASPPVGWQPKPESEPVINYELLEALASLAPGETFELHPHNQEQSHPSIVITPCEPHSSEGPRPPILQTRCPERNA